MIEINRIRIDGGTQSRVELNQSTVTEYAEAMAEGAKFPAIHIFYDGADYWLADGFHRYFAAKKAGLTQIWEEITPGTKRDAILYSLGANARHGMRRTNADKRKAVEMLLADAEWKQWSQEQIAKTCGVSIGLVSKMVSELSLHGEEMKPPKRAVTRNGTTYTQDTTNIGKRTAPPERVEVDRKPDPEPEYFGPSDEEIAEAEAAAIAEAEALQARLAADGELAKLAEINKRQAAEIAALKATRDGYMNQCAEQVRKIKSLQRRLDKLEKARAV